MTENVECRTCGGSGEVARTVALPGHALATTVTRYDACTRCHGAGSILRYDRPTLEPAERIDCPDCTENVEEPT